MKEISVAELKNKIDSGEEFQLIDVRENDEVEYCNIDGEHIPMGEVMERLGEIRKDVPVIVHCKSGARSGAIVQALESGKGFSNVYNLKGGILAWAREIDPSIPQY